MGKSNFETEQLLEQISEDKIPESIDPQELVNSSNEEEDNSSPYQVLVDYVSFK